MDAFKAVLGRVWGVWKKVGHTITKTLNFVLLMLAYALAIGPVSLILRLTGEDILDKKWTPQDPRPSFWRPRDPVPDDPERFLRQF